MPNLKDSARLLRVMSDAEAIIADTTAAGAAPESLDLHVGTFRGYRVSLAFRPEPAAADPERPADPAPEPTTADLWTGTDHTAAPQPATLTPRAKPPANPARRPRRVKAHEEESE